MKEKFAVQELSADTVKHNACQWPGCHQRYRLSFHQTPCLPACLPPTPGLASPVSTRQWLVQVNHLHKLLVNGAQQGQAGRQLSLGR